MTSDPSDRWQQISPLLDRALDMTGDQRPAWLASLRAQDPDLAADIEALLREHEALRGERFLESQAASLPAQPAAPGQQVGAYTLVSPIGYGGMGTVWLAERSDGRFERRAAVKFLNIALIGRGEARFRREGRILGRLRHPHIAQLIDAGVTSAGHAYLVLEYVEGEPIDQYCDRRALDVNARIGLVRDVLSAAAHAHANLVVHRDIKPSNVLVTGDGEVKLLDFGIARLLENDQPAARTMVTNEGAGPFTPEYAAPEQLTGEPITTATDIYALGVLLFVLLTGQHPAGAFLSSPAALVHAITEIDPPRPSEIVGRNLRRPLRGDLDTIVARALEKRPHERYASVTALADDLRRYLAHEPVAARPDTLAYRAGKFVRRNRPAVALATLAFIAAVAGAAGTLLQARTARVQRDFALRQLFRAEAINDLNSFILSDAAPSGKPFTVNELLARAERIVSRQHGGNEANRVGLLISIGAQYYGQDEDGSSRRVLMEAYRQSRSLSDPSIRARASCALAAALGATGDIPRAEALFQEGLRELPGDAQFAVDRAFCLLKGSAVAREAGRPNDAVARGRAAQMLLENSPVQSDIQKLHVAIDVAESYRTAGRLREANAAFARAAALLTSLGRDNTETAGTLYNNWAMTLYFLGRPGEAERLFGRAIGISRAGGDDQGVSPMLLVNEARALRDLGRLAAARDYAERGHRAAQRAGDDVVLNQCLLLQASVYRMEGQLDRAATALAEVEPRLRRALPAGHYAFGALMREQALLAASRGHWQEARATADRAIALVEAAMRSGRQGREILAPLLIQRSDAERELGRTGDAAADATYAVAVLQSVVEPGSLSNMLGAAYLALGRALLAQGKRDGAAAAFRAAFTQLNGAIGPDHPDTQTARQLVGLMAPAR